jgi:hypothetical protein
MKPLRRLALLTLLATLSTLPVLAGEAAPSCLPEGDDPLVALFAEQAVPRTITCTITCSSGGGASCVANTCGEFINGSGQRCLQCDGLTRHCCPLGPDPICLDECENAYDVCASKCKTRTCLGDCRDELDACRANC